MKKYLQLVFLLSSLSYASLIHAQLLLDTIDYNSFAAYNVKYRSLVFDGKSTYNYKSNSINNQFSNKMYVDYIEKKNLYDLQSDKYFSNYFNSYRIGKGKFFVQSFYTANNRYYKKSNLFFEFGQQHYFDLDNNYFVSNKPYRSTNLTTNFNFRIGKGRINPIEEVFVVSYIIDEFKKEGIDVSGIDKEKLYAFAQLYAGLKNTRILDARRQRANQLYEMIKFVKENFLTTDQQSAMASTIIADNIFFAYDQSRSVGQRFSIGIRPEIVQTYSNGNFTRSSIILGSSIDLNYNFTTSISRFFHFSTGASISTGIKKRLSYQDITYEVNHNVEFQVGYYPSSRSEIRGIVQMYGNVFLVSNLNTGIKARYFLNYNTSLTLSANYNIIAISDQSIFDGGFSILHAFF